MLRVHLRQRQPTHSYGDDIDALPAQPRLVEAADRVADQHALGGVIANEPSDIDAVASRLREAAHRPDASFATRDLEYAPHCLWSGSYPLAEMDAEASQCVIQAIVEGRRRGPVRTLAVAYLRHYAPTRPGMDLAGRALQRTAPSLGGRLGALASDFDTFDLEQGVHNLAAYCLSVDRTPRDVLAAYGLAGDTLHRGFAAQAARHGLDKMAAQLMEHPSAEIVARADRWAFGDGAAAFDQAESTFLHTVVAAFQDRDPDQALKQWILDLVIQRVGDPRLNPQAWRPFPAELAIVRRWLNAASSES